MEVQAFKNSGKQWRKYQKTKQSTRFHLKNTEGANGGKLGKQRENLLRMQAKKERK